MRITNQMLTNSILLNINRNQETMAEYEIQMATGKKIQQASDDPVVAIRALRFRTTVNEIEQFMNNAEDAVSWNSISEQAVSNITDVVQRIRELCVQGASDVMSAENRETIVTEINELMEQFVNENNASYAGRYVFGGHKTDIPLIFLEPSTDQYRLTEHFSSNGLEEVQRVVDSGGSSTITDAYRLRLGYRDITTLDTATLEGDLTAAGFPTLPVNVDDTMSSTDAGAYEPAAGQVHFLADTGELIFNKDDAAAMAALATPFGIDVTYEKHSFEKDDLRPDHYFDGENLTQGTSFNVSSGPEEMLYQVSYSQEMAINTMAYEVVPIDMQRDVEELVAMVYNIDHDDTLESELKEELFGDAFGDLLGKLDGHIDTLLNTRATIGGRISRLELTINRLEEDRLNYTDILSENEDVDFAETYIKMASIETIYQASLSASSKVLQPTLLDFLR